MKFASIHRFAQPTWPQRIVACAVLYMLGMGTVAVRADDGTATLTKTFAEKVSPFLKANCLACHGPEKKKGDITLHQLSDDINDAQGIATWAKVMEQLEIGAMPPEDKKQPSPLERSQVVEWIKELQISSGKAFEVRSRMLLPEFGNRVDHDLLFNGSIKEMPSSPPRLWRISPYIFLGKGFQPGPGVKNEPITYSTKSEGLRDYSTQEIVGESGFSMLMMAFDDILSKQMHDVKTVSYSKVDSKKGNDKADPKKTSEVKENVEITPGNPTFKAIAEAAGRPARESLERGVRDELSRAMGRPIDGEELARYVTFMEKNIAQAGNESGLKIGIMAIYLSPESIYRLELGLGPADEQGRRMLSPRELSYAISFALTDLPPAKNPLIQEALEKKQLSTKADVERLVRKMIAEGHPPVRVSVPGQFDRYRAQGKKGYAYYPRVVRFFEEFFEYPRCAGVFKDGKHGSFGPRAVPAVAQGHIGAIVNKDAHVFEELLTSPRFNYNRDTILAQLKEDYEQEIKDLPDDKKEAAAKRYQATCADAKTIPLETTRCGFLTDPSWLIAHSKCTENDPVRRGKWIRERLLAGNVPELPIGVAAKIPDDHDRTLRDRFSVVQNDVCWKCHKVMNPLGIVFEQYNDVGRIRTAFYLDKKKREFLETISEKEAENLLKKGEIDVLPLDASGELSGTGDPNLDGPVKDVADLMHRLAKSSRVRQSIIRHAFRFWMGRNETLSDSKTLIAADQAYVNSGGKFSEVIISLLTSDSFLLRK